MQEFIEKWKTDHIFKTKVKLAVSTTFVVLVSIFAFATRKPVTVDGNNDDYSNYIENEQIEIPENYEYTADISINEENYSYTITKKDNEEKIIKRSSDEIKMYIYKNNNYYTYSLDEEKNITKEEVYDIINYNYLNIETINKYLSVAKEKEDYYIVYIKDIVIGQDSEDYITISVNNNSINIDYTSLLKLFDNTIENCKIKIIIEEKE